MISSLYFGAILLGLVINNGSGQPSITSTVQSLSGELCPGRVTFSCDSLYTDSSIIDFLIDDTTLVRYEFSVGITTPVPQGFMARIPSAEFDRINIKYSYENFTLSADLDDLISHLGRNISCGSVAIRSNSIQVGNYTTRDVPPFSSELLNIRSTAVYVGLELKLSEINVVWDDLIFFDDCYLNIRYFVKLTNQDMMQNGDCSNMTCSAKFLLGTEEMKSDVYFINITASSDTQRISSGPISFNASVTNGLTVRSDTDCTQSIVCSSNNNDNCSVQYQESESSLVKLFEVYKERALNFTSGNRVYLEITKPISPNLTFIAQINYTADNRRRNYNDIVGVGVTLMILGFIIEIVGSFVVIHWVVNSMKMIRVEKSRIGQRVFLWVILHGMSWILAIVSLSLWISYGVVNDSGSCTSGPEEYVSIVATLMSILLVVISAVITGAIFILDFKYEKKKPSEDEEHTKSYDERYKLLLGTKYTVTTNNIEENPNCLCGAKFEGVKNWKDIPSVVLRNDVERKKCRGCPKYMCEKCLEYAFKKQTLRWEQVCTECYISYEEENKKILEYPKVGFFKPAKQKCSDICYECGSAEKEDKQECKGCGQWVCSKCIVTKEPVNLQYSKKSENVCRNCYVIIKTILGKAKYEKEENLAKAKDEKNSDPHLEYMQGDEAKYNHVEVESRKSLDTPL